MGNGGSVSSLTSCASISAAATAHPYYPSKKPPPPQQQQPPQQLESYPDLLLLPQGHHRTVKRKPLLSLKRIPKLIRGKLTNTTNNNKHFYSLPPNAETPSPPSAPEVICQEEDNPDGDYPEYFVLRWDPPAYHGGIPIIGYVIQHVELGLPPLNNNRPHSSNSNSRHNTHHHHSSSSRSLTPSSCSRGDPTLNNIVQDSSSFDEGECWYSSDPGEITSTECILNNLVPGTTYQFRVLAENLLGFSAPSPPSPPVVFNPHNELDDWFTPPEFSAILDDNYAVLEHETLTLSVEVRGQPYPVVRWFDPRDVEIPRGSNNNNSYRQRASGFTRSLTISSVRLDRDAGTFRCVAENNQGSATTTTNVVVEAPPRVKRIPHGDLLQSPYDLTEREMAALNNEEAAAEEEEGAELILQAGELLRVKYAFAGEPPPDVSVFHNGDHILNNEQQRVSVEMSERVLTLKVAGVTREDRGEWLVRLENPLGEDSAAALVTVTDHPSVPGRPELLQLPDNTCILKWATPIDDGGCPIHNYIVEYFRFEWGVWLKALTTRLCHARVKDLIPGSKYKFRVKAENLYGTSAPSADSVDILIIDNPSATRATNDGMMRTLDENEEEEEEEEAISLEEALLLQQQDDDNDNELLQQQQQKQLMSAAAAANSGRIPIISRSSLITSSAAATAVLDPQQQPQLLSVPQQQRLRYLQQQLSGESRVSSMDDDDDFGDLSEIDFAKLQAEYEEEMALLADSDQQQQLEMDTEEDDAGDDEDDAAAFERIKRRWDLENTDVFNRASSSSSAAGTAKMEQQLNKGDDDVQYAQLDWGHHHSKKQDEQQQKQVSQEEQEQEQEQEEEEEELYIPQYRVGSNLGDKRSSPSPAMLTDRFTDYLTMKVASRDGRIASSMRSLTTTTSQTSLNKSSSRDASRENIRHLFINNNLNSSSSSSRHQEPSTGNKEQEEQASPKTNKLAGVAAATPPTPTTKSNTTTTDDAPPPPPPPAAPAPPPPTSTTGVVRSLVPLLILSVLLLPVTLYVDVWLGVLSLLLLLLWNKYLR